MPSSVILGAAALVAAGAVALAPLPARAATPAPAAVTYQADSGCTATYTVANAWPGGSQVTITITNTSPYPESSWHVSWTLQPGQQIIAVWNATVSVSGTIIVIVPSPPPGGFLPPGGSFSFGLLISGPTTPVPLPTCTSP